MDADDTLAVVLAGGDGARVGGTDKGLLPLCGRPLIEHVLARLRSQSSRFLVIANRDLQAYASYAPVVHDEGTGHAGPLAGLAAAFEFLVANQHALPHWLLTVPVDCPDPPRNLVLRLRAVLTLPAGATCAYVSRDARPQPLLALYRIDGDPGAWHASAETALHEHGSAWRWHASLGALAVDFDAAGDAFHNLNTPADFGEYERAHEGAWLPNPDQPRTST